MMNAKVACIKHVGSFATYVLLAYV